MREQGERRAAYRERKQAGQRRREDYDRKRTAGLDKIAKIESAGGKYLGRVQPKLSVGPQRSSRTTSPRSQRPKVAAMARPKRPTYGQKHRAKYSDEWARGRRR